MPAWLGQVRSSFVEFFGFLRSNDTYNVERLLRKGFEHVNMREERLGDTPLIFACSRGWAATARLLLQGGGGANRQIGRRPGLIRAGRHWALGMVAGAVGVLEGG